MKQKLGLIMARQSGRNGVTNMAQNILKNPQQLAEEICQWCSNPAQCWAVFGDWCDAYGNKMPAIYIEAIAGHIITIARSL